MTVVQPLVSIVMGTYNHASYVEEALESCLSQQTSFPYEIIVGDDASTDGTQAILRRWAEKHPQIILSLQPRNSKGGKNFIDILRRIRGKYVAFCEGDDYWTVPYKLEKQVRFLEANPDFSICCHRVAMQYEGEHKPENTQYVYKDCDSDDPRIRDGIFHADEAIANYYFQTGSVCFRWRFPHGLPDWFQKRMLYDHFLFMLHAVEGKIKYFDEPMSVWRRHMTGYSWLQTLDKGIFFQKELEDWLRVYSHMDDHFNKRFTWQIRERILLALREVVKSGLATNQLEQVRETINTNSEYLAGILENAVIIDALRLLFPKEKTFFPPWAVMDACEAPSGGIVEDGGKEEEEQTPVKTEPEALGNEANPTITVGDFLELDLEVMPKPANSVWDCWTKGTEYACFANFRAALLAYLWHTASHTVWLPPFMPPVLENMRYTAQIKKRIYHVNHDLSVPTDFLDMVQPGEAVLSICYFGKPTPKNFEKALLKRPDIIWIEDRAQALWPGGTPKANAVIYSPRKVLGVPDGGILIGKGAAAMLPEPDRVGSARVREMTLPLIERFESGSVPGAVRIEHTARTEYRYGVPPGGMSRLSLEMLRRIPMHTVVRQRKENWSVLYGHLSSFALWPVERPSFAPYGFPLVMPSSTLAMMAQVLMARKGYACSRNWTKLAVELRAAPAAEALASKIFILPCDHRYGPDEMHCMAGEVLNIIKGNINHAPRFMD